MQDLPIQEAVLKRKFDNSFSEELHVTALRRKFKGYNTLTQFLVVCYKKRWLYVFPSGATLYKLTSMEHVVRSVELSILATSTNCRNNILQYATSNVMFFVVLILCLPADSVYEI